MTLREFLEDPRFRRFLDLSSRSANWFKEHNFEESINEWNEVHFDLGCLLGETKEWEK